MENNEYQQLLVLFEKTTAAVNKLFSQLDSPDKIPFIDEGFNRYESNLITYLFASSKGLSLSRLARELGMKLPYLSKTVSSLVNKGLIERFQKEGCRRTYYAKLSVKGERLAQQQFDFETAAIKERFNKTFSDDELDDIKNAQQTINEILQKL